MQKEKSQEIREKLQPGGKRLILKRTIVMVLMLMIMMVMVMMMVMMIAIIDEDYVNKMAVMTIVLNDENDCEPKKYSELW